MKYLLLLSTLAISACSDSKPIVECDSQFAEQVGEAIAANDMDRLMEMYYLEGVDEFTRNVLERSFKYDFEKTVAGTEIGEFPEDSLTEYEMNGVQYRINLAPVKQLTIHYADETDSDGGVHKSSTRLPLGKSEGRCFIASAARVSG